MVKYSPFKISRLFCTAAFVAAAFAGWSQTPEEIKKIEDAMPSQAPATPKKKRHVLVYSQTAGYKHASIPYGEKAFEIMGKKTGAFTVDISSDPSVFTKENLNKYDAIIMNNTTGELFTTHSARMALLDFVKDGKGLAGIHAATDVFYDFVPYGQMIGGYFASHPWTANSEPVTLKIDEPDHPVAKPFKGQPFSVQDEIYQFKEQPYSRALNRVLTSLDTTKTKMDIPGVNRRDNDFAVSWVKPYGKGRVFYCSLGHNKHIYWDTTILEHYLAGIQLAMGDLKGPVEPNRELNEQIVKKNIEEVVIAFSTFDYGKNRAFLLKLDDNIRLAVDDKKLLSWVAQKLADVASDTQLSFASREQAYRRLGEIATPALAKKIAEGLTDKDIKIAEAARFALQSIPGSEVNQELIKSADSRTDEAAVGIINALGERKAGGAVDKLKKIAKSSNAALAQAAITALGKIGNQDAGTFLLNQTFATANTQDHLAAAANAGHNLIANHPNLAEKLFTRVLETKDASNAAALSAYNGMLQVSKSPEQEALKALFGPNESIRSVAIGVLAGGKDKAITDNLASLLEKETPENQLRILGILYSRADKSVVPAVAKIADSGEEAPRLAAIELLGYVGDQNVVPQLVKLAGEKNPVAEKAKAALLNLKGLEPDAALVALLDPAGNPKELVAAIEALAGRKATATASDLLKMARTEDAAVAQAAFKAIGELGDGKLAEPVLDIFVTVKNSRVLREAEKTVAILTRDLTDDEQAKLLEATLTKAETTEQKAAVYKVLARTGTPAALKTLRDAAASEDAGLKDGGIRALAEFPTTAALDDLIAIMRAKDSEVHSVLAMRGVARMLSLPSEKSDGEILAIAKEVLENAKTDDEKISVIGQLAELKQFGIAALIRPFLANDATKSDATAALLRIANNSAAFNPQEVGSILSEIEPNLTESQKKNVQQLKKRLTENPTAILGWQYSGPYTLEKPNLKMLFNRPFAPEEKNAADAKWSYIAAGAKPKNSEMVDLSGLEPKKNSVVYLRAYIHSDKDQQVHLLTGSDDGLKGWFNGEEIIGVPGSRAYKKGADNTKINLKTGWNEVLLKVIQGAGDWAASAQITTGDGKLPEGVRFSAIKPAE